MCEHELQTAVTKIYWEIGLYHFMRCDGCGELLNCWPGEPYELRPILPDVETS